MFDTKIILVRHAQGEGNLKGEFHGQYPSDLTPLGVTQAECTAEFLKDYPIDIAFASDIPRAYSTAKIIAEKHGLSVIKEEGVREICGGVWEQMKFDDIVVEYPEEYAVWKNDLGNCTTKSTNYTMLLRSNNSPSLHCRLNNNILINWLNSMNINYPNRNSFIL